MSGWAKAIVDVVYPPRCRGCGYWGAVGADDLCAACAAQLMELVALPCCPRCGGKVASFELNEGRCQECRALSASVEQTARVGPYQDSLRELFLAYKFRHRGGLAPLLSRWLSLSVRSHDWLDRVEVVTFVPSHWRRRLMKPIYPARMLAEHAARDLGLPVAPLLRRVHARYHQIGLSYTARQENVRGAFSMSRGVRLAKARVLLIDDVRTTGATLEECARVLRRGGAAEVFAAVVCKADW